MRRDDPPVLFDAETIAERVGELGAQIERELGGENPLLLSLLGGSVIFLADLVRAIDVPLDYQFIHVDDTHGGSPPVAGGEAVVDLRYPIPLDITDRTVVILKDVVSTGVVETYLVHQLVEKGAAEVRFAALVDLPHERKTGFEVDYSAFTAERRGRLVGYGMKQEGRGGNLPHIAVIEAAAEAPHERRSAADRGEGLPESS